MRKYPLLIFILIFVSSCARNITPEALKLAEIRKEARIECYRVEAVKAASFVKGNMTSEMLVISKALDALSPDRCAETGMNVPEMIASTTNKQNEVLGQSLGKAFDTILGVSVVWGMTTMFDATGDSGYQINASDNANVTFSDVGNIKTTTTVSTVSAADSYNQ